MRSRPILLLAVSAVLALALAACGSSSSNSNSGTSGGSSTSGSGASGSINGAGSTFAQPIYDQWGSNLKGQGLTVNYQPVGSGAGIQQLTAGTVDFAGSDPPMKDAEISAAKGKGAPAHIPTVLGAITVSYNLSGVKAGLKLDGPTIADMFLGKVKTWKDPEIAKLNPGLQLPSTAITIVHRSDSSGTTKGFTSFLAAHSPAWKSKVGADKDVKWPTGTGAKGNAGVAGAIKQTDGGVGYVEAAYALQNNFTFADVKNKSGKFVTPSLDSTTAAGTGVKVPEDLRFTVIDSPSPSAYPIASQTFVVVYQDLCKAGVSKAAASGVVKFLNYGLGAGQDVAKQLQYAPLPAPLVAKAKAKVASLKCNGSPITG
ncbi:MAG TPA: phosphate ABC transporter substrate-binding protein PstS [Solirubrobacteraceae bacterium]|nr:phosphate ABC transporter substrate-binding protein PstS [Solirubrobacteraceae bacterium]